MIKGVGVVARRVGMIAAVVAMLMLGAAGSAQAALTLGTDLTQTADAYPCLSNAETCTNANLTLPPGEQASAPADGVVTSWKARINGTGPISLQVLHPSTPMAAGVSTSATQNVTGTNVIVGPFPTRQPIGAGELIALKATNATIAMSLSTPLFTWVRWEPFLADGGATRAPDSGPFSNSFVVLVNAQVEPDADNDHFGDETQDQCPTNATTQGPCPSGAPSKKKCKKRKHRSLDASAAKKKCKKHRK